jgi:hypothetical protein
VTSRRNDELCYVHVLFFRFVRGGEEDGEGAYMIQVPSSRIGIWALPVSKSCVLQPGSAWSKTPMADTFPASRSFCLIRNAAQRCGASACVLPVSHPSHKWSSTLRSLSTRSGTTDLFT